MKEHTPIPTVTVTARVYTQDGKPVAGAVVSMRLTSPERFGGYIVPREVRADTDAYGVASLRVWPNSLGTEASEYRVSIRCPEGSGGRSINGHAVVPQTNCDLSDIMELPAMGQRSAGAVIPAEVAGYAAQAASARDAAQHLLDATQSAERHVSQMATQAETSEAAARTFAAQAGSQAENAETAAQKAQDTAAAFEVEVAGRVETAVTRLSVEATRMVNEAGDKAATRVRTITQEGTLKAIEAVAHAKADAVTALQETKRLGVEALRAAGKAEAEVLAEEGALYQEDFRHTLERAQDAARKAGCSAFKAGESEKIVLEAEQRVLEGTKLFDSCLDVYAYADTSRQFSEIAGEHATAVQEHRENACACAQAAAESEAVASSSQVKAEKAADRANRDARAARQDAKKAHASMEKATEVADSINLAALYSSLEEVRLLSLSMRSHIAALNNAAAHRGKLLLQLLMPQ